MYLGRALCTSFLSKIPEPCSPVGVGFPLVVIHQGHRGRFHVRVGLLSDVFALVLQQEVFRLEPNTRYR